MIALNFTLPLSAVVLIGVLGASVSASLTAIMLRRAQRNALIQSCRQLLKDEPGLNEEQKLRFSRVMAVSLMRRKTIKLSELKKELGIPSALEPNYSIQPDLADEEFRPATIVYENLGRHSASDTYQREQALANARLALLSMDHTKQIPH